MVKRPDYTRYRDIQSRTNVMVRDFLLEEIYHDTDPAELAQEWDIEMPLAQRLCRDQNLTFTELFFLLELTGVNVGTVIRDPASGREITFFAMNNLVEEEDDEQIYITEENVDYREGLEGIPRVHEVDGSYTIQESGVENPFETKEDVIDAEFSEVDRRDLAEIKSSTCENCMTNERVDDSRLCHMCLEAGVEASPLDPLELVARVDTRAAEARESSRQLIEQAKSLLQKDREEEEEEEDFEEEEEEDTPRRKPSPGEDEEEEGGEYIWLDRPEDQYDPQIRRKFFDFADDEEEE